jgi:5-methylcytosine-specific restriction endonuclease McrA
MTIPLPPYSSIKPRKKKRAQVRVGKEGIVRLSGAALEDLRLQCFRRDKGRCQDCGQRVMWDAWTGASDSYHMAHIRNKRMYGDTLSNVRVLCGDCHRAEHGNPLPKMRTHTEGREN